MTMTITKEMIDVYIRSLNSDQRAALENEFDSWCVKYNRISTSNALTTYLIENHEIRILEANRLPVEEKAECVITFELFANSSENGNDAIERVLRQAADLSTEVLEWRVESIHVTSNHGPNYSSWKASGKGRRYERNNPNQGAILGQNLPNM